MQERTCDGKALAVEWYKRCTETDGGALRHDFVLLRCLLPHLTSHPMDVWTVRRGWNQ